MKRIRCLNVSSNIPENGNTHRWVQHGYFREGVVNRGKILTFFGNELGSPKKGERVQNHGKSKVRAYRNVYLIFS